MRIAVTGATGFVGTHLTRRLCDRGDDLVVLARGRRSIPAHLRSTSIIHGSVADRHAVDRAVDAVDAIVHLAGINHERGSQTYGAVHVRGTANVVAAAAEAGVDRLVVTSYLRARPGTSSPYLSSKWRTEQLVRAAGVPSTILKPAGIFGRGDQLLTSLARWIRTLPVLPVPWAAPPLRPVAVDDVATVLTAAITDDRMAGRTYALMGPATVRVSELARRVARQLDTVYAPVPVPAAVLTVGGLQEHLLSTPLLTRDSARMLIEGMTEPRPTRVCEPVPADMVPRTAPNPQYLRGALDDPSPLRLSDLRRP